MFIMAILHRAGFLFSLKLVSDSVISIVVSSQHCHTVSSILTGRSSADVFQQWQTGTTVVVVSVLLAVSSGN